MLGSYLFNHLMLEWSTHLLDLEPENQVVGHSDNKN